MSKMFTVPVGTILLAHRTAQAIPGRFTRKDFAMVVSTREVMYDYGDVCVDPLTKQCTSVAITYGLFDSPWVQDGEMWGFRIPENPRGVSFILVRIENVKVGNTVTPEQTERLRKWVQQVIPVDDKKWILPTQDIFTDIIEKQAQDVANEIMREVDEQIMNSSKPIFGAP